jgi:PiT family inorganic phosphate transporter
MRQASRRLSLGIVIALVLVALAFDFMNGFHDAGEFHRDGGLDARAQAAPGGALAAFFNFVAVFVFHLSVATHRRQGHRRPGHRRPLRRLRRADRRHRWNFITWYYGIPPPRRMR